MSYRPPYLLLGFSTVYVSNAALAPPPTTPTDYSLHLFLLMSSIVYFVNLHILVKGSHSSGSSPCSLRSGVFQYFLMLDPDSCVVYDLRLCLGVSRDGVSECVSECVSE